MPMILWRILKVYPKQSMGCLAVGASVGAVDPKTHRKWVWAFIDALADLVDVVVSFTAYQLSPVTVEKKNQFC